MVRENPLPPFPRLKIPIQREIGKPQLVVRVIRLPARKMRDLDVNPSTPLANAVKFLHRLRDIFKMLNDMMAEHFPKLILLKGPGELGKVVEAIRMLIWIVIDRRYIGILLA